MRDAIFSPARFNEVINQRCLPRTANPNSPRKNDPPKKVRSSHEMPNSVWTKHEEVPLDRRKEGDGEEKKVEKVVLVFFCTYCMAVRDGGAGIANTNRIYRETTQYNSGWYYACAPNSTATVFG